MMCSKSSINWIYKNGDNIIRYLQQINDINNNNKIKLEINLFNNTLNGLNTLTKRNLNLYYFPTMYSIFAFRYFIDIVNSLNFIIDQEYKLFINENYAKMTKVQNFNLPDVNVIVF